MKQFTPKEEARIRQFSELLPRAIQVSIQRSEDGGFVAEVLSLPGVITEAETFSELIGMVNDAVAMRFDVPEKYRSYIPSYLPPLEAVADLSLFPTRENNEEVTLRLAVHGGTASR